MTTYQVTGGVPYLGHAPGDKFDAELDEAQERRALARGSIKRVGKAAPKAKDDEQGEG